MRKLILFIALLGLVACESNSSGNLSNDKIVALEKELRSFDYLDTALAGQLASAYQAYLKDGQKDSLKPHYHLRLAKLYRAWPNRHDLAIATFKEVEEKYAYHEVAPQALIEMGLFLEEMGAKDAAVASYRNFLDRFPSHEYASQVQDLMDMALNEHVTDIQRVQEWKKNSVKK